MRLKSLDDCREAIRYRVERDVEWEIESAMKSLKEALKGQMNVEAKVAEKVARLEKNRLVLPMIEDAISGIAREGKGWMSVYQDGHDIDVKLENGANYKPVLVEIRKILGAPLVQVYKEILEDGENVKVSLKCDEYPGLFVFYIRPYTPTGKCRIVERVIRSLECQA